MVILRAILCSWCTREGLKESRDNNLVGSVFSRVFGSEFSWATEMRKKLKLKVGGR